MKNMIQINKKGQAEGFIAIIVVVLLFILFGVGFYFLWNIEVTKTNESISSDATTNEYLVTRIVDGDTFEIETGEKVRFICINTPEKGEYYFDEASQYLSSQILNKKVILEKDVNNKDVYGRLLRWVWLDGGLINERIVKNGYGKYAEYQPDIKYCPAIGQSEVLAKTQEMGIWKKN